MKQELEKIKQELISKINKIKQDRRDRMHVDDLRAEYDGYVGIYYTEDLVGIPFYTLEIYKANKLLAHATLDKRLEQTELDDKLKNYVEKKKQEEKEIGRERN